MNYSKQLSFMLKLFNTVLTNRYGIKECIQAATWEYAIPIHPTPSYIHGQSPVTHIIYLHYTHLVQCETELEQF